MVSLEGQTPASDLILLFPSNRIEELTVCLS
jgi:hypothetical protein